ncbi:MAG: cytidylate kinase [Flavobacteriaceae bacterium]|nr:cytidylate kinase [Flavobacteriaceae bacterium]|tara:strand:+ start:12797 stop:13462 length:666 start_codon:yes stop_codon:yes gene_type:complete
MKIKIAIDGFAATGKSTQAKKIAKYYGFKHIDSGAMYRAVTYFAISNGWLNNKINKNKILENLEKINISFQDFNNNQHTILNNVDIEENIRKMDVADKVSQIAIIPEIRYFLLQKQRLLAQNNSIVMDGRDIGTVVFPNAEYKFFLTANEEERVKRRYDELRNQNNIVDFKSVLKNLKNRDSQDTSRSISPMEPANDAIIIDTSNKSIEFIFNKIISFINL